VQQNDHEPDAKRQRLEKLCRELHRACREGFYGVVEIKFNAGDPVLLERRQTVKVDDLK